MTVLYSREEVAGHNKAKDLWIIIHGGVYDLTKFLQEHPGGEEVLMNLAGRDGTACFDEMGHTEEAKQLRETFKIGEATGSDVLPTSSAEKGPSVDDDDWVYEEPKPKSSNLLPIFVGVLVAIYAIIFYSMA